MTKHNVANSTSLGDTQILNQRYELHEREAVGGMAYVYRAKDVVLHRVVAVKVLRDHFSGDSNLVKQFLGEARAVAHLSHENVVTIHDVGSDGQQHYIILEHIAGDNLKAHIRLNAPFRVERTLDYAIQICAGVGHAHRQGLVHCDIKPQNILVTPLSKVKVADFGISRILNATQPVDTTATLFGTPHYFSPEQAQGSPATPASDVDSQDAQLLGHMHLNTDPPDVRIANPVVPDTLAEIIAKVLAKEPAARYRSAEHLGHVLTTFRDQGAHATLPYLALNSDEIDAQIVASARVTPTEQEGVDRTGTASDWVTYLLGGSAALLVLGLLALWTRVFWRLAPILLSEN